MASKILFCCNYYPPYFVGGAELIVHQQALKLQKAGHEVAVFCGLHDDREVQYHLREDRYEGIQVFRVLLHAEDFRIANNFVKSSIDSRFREVVQSFQPHIIHFHNLIGLSLGMIDVAASFGAKTILTFHDHWGFCFKNTLLKQKHRVCHDFSGCAECLPALTKETGVASHIRLRLDYLSWQLSKVQQFISPSEYLASAYIQAGISPQRIKAISNGIDISRFARIGRVKSEQIRFTFIGYMGFHKGVHVLLEAIKILVKQPDLGTSWMVNMVGAGELLEELKKTISEQNLHPIVKVWGKVEHQEIDQIYAQTDVLVSPSVWPENEPVTILEAMATGIPVIGSQLGGIPELISHGESGLLFEAGNAPALAAAMAECIKTPSFASQLGQGALEQVQFRTLDNYVLKIRQIYDSLPQENVTHPRGVICIGLSISSVCLQVLSHVDLDRYLSRYHFLRMGWLSSQDWKHIDLIWIVDSFTTLEEIHPLLSKGIPLIVPAENPSLVNFCDDYQCGLYYSTPLEAQVCFRLLRERPDLRQALGQNAKKSASVMSK